MVALIIFGAAWIVVLAMLLADVFGHRQRNGYFRWQATGALVQCTGMLATAFGQVRHWPAGQLAAARHVSMALVALGLATQAIAGAVRLRARHRSRTTGTTSA